MNNMHYFTTYPVRTRVEDSETIDYGDVIVKKEYDKSNRITKETYPNESYRYLYIKDNVLCVRPNGIVHNVKGLKGGL
jgi:hypothetical protein